MSIEKSIYVFAILLNHLVLSGQTIPLTPDRWEIIDNENNQKLDLQTTIYAGRSAIHLGRHEIAKLKTTEYKNFTLEMKITGKSMPGIGFRAKDLWNYEFFYCRVFSGEKYDALQYIPVYNGAHPWQLYNDPIYESSAKFQPEEWFHLKMEVYGNYMRVFIGDSKVPNMEVELQQDDLSTGSILLKTSFSEAYFGDIKIQALTAPFTIKEQSSAHTYLKDWRVSEQLQGSIHSQGQYFQQMALAEKNHQWQAIKADKMGLVNLAKHFEHPRESVFATTNIDATKDKVVTLAFDYTAVLMITLNDQILFYGRELDMDNFMRVKDEEQTIPLPLISGKNKLVFWIRSDDEWQEAVGNPSYLGRKQAMNWGFVARIID